VMNVVRLLMVVSGLLLASVLVLFSPALFSVVLGLACLGYAYRLDKEFFKEIVIRAFPIVCLVALFRWVLDEEQEDE